MKQSNTPGIFPWFSLLTGIVGFAMRSWLFSLTDRQGLLPQNHIAGVLPLLLLAVTMVVYCLWVRKAQAFTVYAHVFPQSVISALGALAGALGLGYTAFFQKSTGFLQLPLLVLGVLCAAALLLIALCRFQGRRPHYLLRSIVTFYLILRTVVCCRAWGTQPQLQLYLFPLLASLFLMLACYQHAELDFRVRNYRWYGFFNQAALFCCFQCVFGQDWLFYLSMGIWMSTDFCRFSPSEQA